jgi:hypothetical protein
MTALLLCCTVLLCSTGCASGKGPVETNDVLVRYLAVSDKPEIPSREFVLIHENHSRFDSVYAASKETASVKRIPGDLCQFLLSNLDDLGFFDTAEVGRFPDAQSKQIIMVETPLQSWILSPNPSFTLEDRRKFREMSRHIWDYHNAIVEFQVIDNPQGKNIFLDRNKQQQKENDTRQMK